MLATEDAKTREEMEVSLTRTNEDGNANHNLARLTDWLQGLFLPRRRRCQYGVMRT